MTATQHMLQTFHTAGVTMRDARMAYAESHSEADLHTAARAVLAFEDLLNRVEKYFPSHPSHTSHEAPTSPVSHPDSSAIPPTQVTLSLDPGLNL